MFGRYIQNFQKYNKRQLKMDLKRKRKNALVLLCENKTYEQKVPEFASIKPKFNFAFYRKRIAKEECEFD